MRNAAPLALAMALFSVVLFAQEPPYDNPPAAEPPYYRVRYEASSQPGELIFPVTYTVWVPPGVELLRGIVVHQHGCGEGSCKSGQSGAFDLHWQALARKHHCALMSPSYEQPAGTDCQMWCDPRTGSDMAFQQSLSDLGKQCGHDELATVPWALWGHSGGGHWAGGMMLLHPERVVAAWLRSGVPLLEPVDGRSIQPHRVPEAALEVPVMCNLGTREGVTVTTGRFAEVWPNNEAFFQGMRSQGALIAVAIDPLTAHECGNSRYLAIPWLDACLSARLPAQPGDPLKPMPQRDAWVAPLQPGEAKTSAPVPAMQFSGDLAKSIWLPNRAIAEAWSQYINDTAVADTTPPPAPTNILLNGNVLTWEAEADLESGISHFIIQRDGQVLATVPEQPSNPFGRPLFQGLQYSDTPTVPLAQMRFTLESDSPGQATQYRVKSVNTAGLVSQ